MSQIFDSDQLLSLVRARGLRYGQPLYYFEETTSTNDEALSAARSGAPHGSLFVAGKQSQGRGRRGRNWFSSQQESLTFSLLVRPRIQPQNAAAISLVVGLAVHDALSPYIGSNVEQLGIKWPNDIVYQRKKLAGILIEMSQTADSNASHSAIVIGVGINLGTRDFPPELRELATSLVLITGTTAPVPELLLATLLEALEKRIESFVVHGLVPCLAELARYDALLGHEVQVDELRGIADGISERGELLLKRGDTVLRVTSGTVLYT